MRRREEPHTPPANAEPQCIGDGHILFDVNVRLSRDQNAAIEGGRPVPTPGRFPSDNELRELAANAWDARRMRDRMLPRGLFGEPAWDMLLALYCLPERGEQLTVSSLCYASGVPLTTALRWQKTLRAQGYMERGAEGTDRRKQIVRLTEEGRAALEEYLTRLFHLGTPVAPGAGAGG